MTTLNLFFQQLFKSQDLSSCQILTEYHDIEDMQHNSIMLERAETIEPVLEEKTMSEAVQRSRSAAITVPDYLPENRDRDLEEETQMHNNSAMFERSETRDQALDEITIREAVQKSRSADITDPERHNNSPNSERAETLEQVREEKSMRETPITITEKNGPSFPRTIHGQMLKKYTQGNTYLESRELFKVNKSYN